MKKIVFLSLATFVLSSCSSIYVTVTDNPVGEKIGKINGLKEANIGNAAKAGDITEIGTVKYQFKGAKSEVIVTGN